MPHPLPSKVGTVVFCICPCMQVVTADNYRCRHAAEVRLPYDPVPSCGRVHGVPDGP